MNKRSFTSMPDLNVLCSFKSTSVVVRIGVLQLRKCGVAPEQVREGGPHAENGDWQAGD